MVRKKRLKRTARAPKAYGIVRDFAKAFGTTMKGAVKYAGLVKKKKRR